MFRDFTKYEVYDDGRVWSYKSNKFLKPHLDKDGYYQIRLTGNEGKQKSYLVHRVVYESVSGEPIPEGMQVNHINEDKTDNRFFENLNLLTPKENTNWGTCVARRAKTNTNNPKHSKQVGAYKDGELVMTFPSLNEAYRQGFHSGHISECCRNSFHREGNNVYKGYTWKYI